jgi:hypothetical protein
MLNGLPSGFSLKVTNRHSWATLSTSNELAMFSDKPLDHQN